MHFSNEEFYIRAWRFQLKGAASCARIPSHPRAPHSYHRATRTDSYTITTPRFPLSILTPAPPYSLALSPSPVPEGGRLVTLNHPLSDSQQGVATPLLGASSMAPAPSLSLSLCVRP